MDSLWKLPGPHGETFSDIPNEVLFKYIENKVDLEVAREMTIQDMNSLQQKRTSLMDEKKKLNELHQRVFLMNNNLCESVWMFSNEYDIPKIIQTYLNSCMATGKVQSCHNDEFARLKSELQKLSTDVANIERDLQELSNRSELINVKEESCIYVQSPTFKLESPEVPKVHNNILVSKFSVKKPSSISRLFKKR